MGKEEAKISNAFLSGWLGNSLISKGGDVRHIV